MSISRKPEDQLRRLNYAGKIGLEDEDPVAPEGTNMSPEHHRREEWLERKH